MNKVEIHSFKDPRCQTGFLPDFLPLSDLGDPPLINPLGRNDRIRLEFLSLYYEINVAFASIGGDCDSTERACLEVELDTLQHARAMLEDFYAPLGIIAEPTLVRGFAVNLAFTFPDESRWFQQRQATGPTRAVLHFSQSAPSSPDYKKGENV